MTPAGRRILAVVVHTDRTALAPFEKSGAKLAPGSPLELVTALDPDGTWPDAVLIVTDNHMHGVRDAGERLLQRHAHAAGALWTGGDPAPGVELRERLVRGRSGFGLTAEEALAAVERLAELGGGNSVPRDPRTLASLLSRRNPRTEAAQALTGLGLRLAAAALLLPEVVARGQASSRELDLLERCLNPVRMRGLERDLELACSGVAGPAAASLEKLQGPLRACAWAPPLGETGQVDAEQLATWKAKLDPRRTAPPGRDVAEIWWARMEEFRDAGDELLEALEGAGGPK